MRRNLEFIHRFLNPPPGSFFLLGPRGTGKSTWLKHRYPNSLRLDLLDPETFRIYGARPERLREWIEGSPKIKQIVLDEIQKLPDLLPVVHQLIEEKRGWQFILTGSSARKLKRTGADLLGGRAVVRGMYPFMAAEMAGGFALATALESGTLPIVCSAVDPKDVLKAYAALYLKEEVQTEGLVRNVGQFARFLEVASFSHASTVNASNIARECQVERKVVEGYLTILDDLLLTFRIPVFTKRAKRELSAHPKLYFFDAGVYRSLRPHGPLDRPSEIDGAALEGLVAQHLRAWSDYGAWDSQLGFWRTRSGVEVDFVVYGPKGFWAIEVKNEARVQDSSLRGLQAFQEDYPEATALLLYRGRERLKVKGILCVPCEEFLRQLRPQLPLDSEL